MTATFTEPLETATVSGARLVALCEQKDVYWNIGWYWSGRNRCGRLVLRNTDHKVLSVHDYYRATMKWNGADTVITERMRTGSPRHLAVLEAVQFLEQYQA